MNVLLIGSGGREHALAWKIAQSEYLNKLYIAPGNAGTAEIGENVDIAGDDFESLAVFSAQNNIELVVVGPEDPLVKGISDFFAQHPLTKKIPVFGPSQEGAQLEGSKKYAKAFMLRNNIPTGNYFTATKENIDEAVAHLHKEKAPYVLKADGLAAGKGVLIINDLDEAITELKAMLDGKFGEASKEVVIEQHLSGIELSVFVITDGQDYIMLPEAKDYKRIGEGDTGLNTGGMGCVSPVPFANDEFLRKVENRIVVPTVEGLKREGIPYKGFVFIGLMNCDGEPHVIEYNVRMGDPETEVIMPRLEGDLLKVLLTAAKGSLLKNTLSVSDKSCTTVMLVSGGYPGSYEKGKEITKLNKVKDSIVFHAGTKAHDGKVFTNGGRVLSISSLADDFKSAVAISNKNAEVIQFEKKNYRKDIGFDL